MLLESIKWPVLINHQARQGGDDLPLVGGVWAWLITRKQVSTPNINSKNGLWSIINLPPSRNGFYSIIGPSPKSAPNFLLRPFIQRTRNEEREMRNGRYVPLKIGNPTLVTASILFGYGSHSGSQSPFWSPSLCGRACGLHGYVACTKIMWLVLINL